MIILKECSLLGDLMTVERIIIGKAAISFITDLDARSTMIHTINMIKVK